MSNRPNRARQRAARAAQAAARDAGQDASYTDHLNNQEARRRPRPRLEPAPELTAAARIESTERFARYRRSRLNEAEHELSPVVVESPEELTAPERSSDPAAAEELRRRDAAAAYELLGRVLEALRPFGGSHRVRYMDGWANPHNQQVRLDWAGEVTCEEVLDCLLPMETASIGPIGIPGLQLNYYPPAPHGQASLTWFPDQDASPVRLNLSYGFRALQPDAPA